MVDNSLYSLYSLLHFDVFVVIVRFRGKVRTHQLVTKGDTRATYNIINGDSRDMPTLPDPIPKPNQNDFQANGRRW